MRPKKQGETKQLDMLRARLDQIINLDHELARLSREIDWAWIDGDIAPLFSDKGRPGLVTRFCGGAASAQIHLWGVGRAGL